MPGSWRISTAHCLLLLSTVNQLSQFLARCFSFWDQYLYFHNGQSLVSLSTGRSKSRISKKSPTKGKWTFYYVFVRKFEYNRASLISVPILSNAYVKLKLQWSIWIWCNRFFSCTLDSFKRNNSSLWSHALWISLRPYFYLSSFITWNPCLGD